MHSVRCDRDVNLPSRAVAGRNRIRFGMCLHISVMKVEVGCFGYAGSGDDLIDRQIEVAKAKHGQMYIFGQSSEHTYIEFEASLQALRDLR